MPLTFSRLLLVPPTLSAALFAGRSAPDYPEALEPETHDVLVIVADDLGWFDVDTIPTPSIDQLAAVGQEFRAAYAHPLCSPSRFTIQFGRQGIRDDIGAGINTVPPGADPAQHPSSPARNLSIAEMMKAKGYSTFSAGKWHLTNSLGGTKVEGWRVHGYDEVRVGTTGSIGNYSAYIPVNNGVTGTTEHQYNTSLIAEATADWWETTAGPKFACVNFNAPHDPIHVPHLDDLPPGTDTSSGPFGPTLRQQFEWMTMSMDMYIGQLLESVDLSTTLVIFLADNGTAMNVTGPSLDETKVKGSVFEGGVAVPFVVAGSWTVPSTPRYDLVSTADIAATLAELVGFQVPQGQFADSISFLPVLTEPFQSTSREVAFSCYYKPNGDNHAADFGKYMARDRRYKLMQLENDPVYGSTEMMFDMRLDPGEAAPLDLGSLLPLQQLSYRRLSSKIAEMRSL